MESLSVETMWPTEKEESIWWCCYAGTESVDSSVFSFPLLSNNVSLTIGKCS